MVEQKKLVFANRQTLMRVTKDRSSWRAMIAHMMKKKICMPVCAKFCQSLSSANLLFFSADILVHQIIQLPLVCLRYLSSWQYFCLFDCLFTNQNVWLSFLLSVCRLLSLSTHLFIKLSLRMLSELLACRHNYFPTWISTWLCHLHWADISRSRQSLIIHISIASITAILGGQLRTSSLNTAFLAIIRLNHYLLILFYFIFAASFLWFYLFARIFFLILWYLFVRLDIFN